MKLILEFLWRGLEESGRDPSASALSVCVCVCVCVCRVFPSIALQMIVEFPNNRNSGHCSNIYISPVIVGSDSDLQGTSFHFCSKQLQTDSFVTRHFY
jgi:hypothetical protein